MVHRLRLAAAAVSAFALLAVTGSPAFATNKCASAKIKAAGKKAACKLSLRGKNASSGDPIDPAKETKCEDKFTKACNKAKSAGDCSAQLQSCTAIETEADTCVATLSSGSSPSGAFLE